MKKIIFLLFCFLVAGCGNERIGYCTFKSKWYIQSYSTVNDFQISLYSMQERSFYLRFDGETVTWQDKNEKLEKFRECMEKYDDQSYNDYLCTPSQNNALANELIAISFVSDSDYDDQHPAGTPLDDIICFSGLSYYSFVKGGYDYNHWNSFDKALTELTVDDLKLLEVYPGHRPALAGKFRFISPPTESRSHTVTLTVTDADNNTFTTTKLIDFDNSSLWVQ